MTSKIITTERLFQKCRFCFGLICPNCFQLDLNTGTGPFKGYFSDSSFMLPRYIFEPWKQKGLIDIVTLKLAEKARKSPKINGLRRGG